ncbi:MAG: hypothetical protein NZ954_01000 [Thermofilaceae archaeon]|nr:hypothetical protein [Thermofilaceae archaeon]MCX8180240.1 hypothetical protein [Thermofilaceae archaeon]
MLYLEMNQPIELKKEPPTRVSEWVDLVDEAVMRKRFEEAAGRCYTQLMKVLEELIPHGFKVGVKVSGTFLEQAERWGKWLLEELTSLVSRGAVELIAGPYFNSPPLLIPNDEFVDQVRLHVKKVEEVFGCKPRVFAGPYLAYSDEVGRLVSDELGFKAALTEGVAQVLAWRSPHFVYKHPARDLLLLPRDQTLSNEIAFGLGKWLTAAILAEKASHVEGHAVLLGVPAETFGLAIPATAGVFEFLRWLPRELAKYPWASFATPSEAIEKHEPIDVLSIPNPVSWLESGDLRLLSENLLQQVVLSLLTELRGLAAEKGYQKAWRLLTQSDLLLSLRNVSTAIRALKATCALREALAG